MDAFHERLARVGLAAGRAYGFALAGGYVVQANGMLDRPSEDVDLFTTGNRRGEFEAAVTAVVDAYAADGLQISVEQRLDTFARLSVTDPTNGHVAKVELGANWRANEPVHMSIGPVLHPDDAVANKMGALYGRAQARDFVDIDAVARSGRYSRERLLTLAAHADRGFDRRTFGEVLGRPRACPPVTSPCTA